MSFHVDMSSVYQSFIDVWSSLMPFAIPFVAIAIAVALLAGVIFVMRKVSDG